MQNNIIGDLSKMKRILVLLFIIKIAVNAYAENCGVVPITAWGGSPLKRLEALPGPVNIAVVQHTVTPECASDDECERLVDGIRTYHIRGGFDDIGPSFLIGGNGKVYQGAGWQHVGAHTRGYNKRAIGISFIGDFTEKVPSPLALKALRNLLACGVQNKYLTEGYHLVAHSQLSQTQSPGHMLQIHVELWPHWLDHAKEMLD